MLTEYPEVSQTARRRKLAGFLFAAPDGGQLRLYPHVISDKFHIVTKAVNQARKGMNRMKKSLAGLLCTIALLHFTQVASRANIVGFASQVWPDHGYILINNPFDAAGSDNHLSSLFSSLPDSFTGPGGGKVELWDPVANNYTTASHYLGSGSWTIDYNLPPGIGARLYSPVAYTNTYVGQVLTGDGVPAGVVDVPDFVPPSPFSGPAGTYLLGTITPMTVTGEDAFLWTLGRGPKVGETFATLSYSTTYLGGGSWDNGEPSLGIAESAFFTIPEPTTLSLLGLGSLALVMAKRRR